MIRRVAPFAREVCFFLIPHLLIYSCFGCVSDSMMKVEREEELQIFHKLILNFEENDNNIIKSLRLDETAKQIHALKSSNAQGKSGETTGLIIFSIGCLALFIGGIMWLASTPSQKNPTGDESQRKTGGTIVLVGASLILLGGLVMGASKMRQYMESHNNYESAQLQNNEWKLAAHHQIHMIWKKYHFSGETDNNGNISLENNFNVFKLKGEDFDSLMISVSDALGNIEAIYFMGSGNKNIAN